MPILSDSGILPPPLGTAVLGTGVAGEFWPITVMSVFLTGVYGAAAEIALLAVFGVITIGAALLAMRSRRASSRSCARPSIRPGRLQSASRSRCATGSVAFFSATALPLVVAIVGIGTDRGAIDDDVGASLIGAAMVSVLVYPLIATAVARAEEWSPDAVASTEAEY